MNKYFKEIIAYCILLLLVACGPKKGIVTKKKDEKPRTETSTASSETVNASKTAPKESVSEPEAPIERVPKSASAVDIYIATYADISMTEMRRYHIPASITLAQGILESGAGKGRLAKEANNHFGIKCHSWKGDRIYHDDDRAKECFRKYDDPNDSYEDHSKFLTGRGRYASLFDLDEDDYKGWAKGLKKAGYATDRNYPKKLIDLIERYKLYEYDDEVLNGRKRTRKKSKNKVVETEPVKYSSYTVQEGDTLYSLSRRFGMSVEELKSLNGLSDNTINIGQTLKVPNK